MSSRVVSGTGSRRPSLHVAPRASDSFGGIAGKFASDYGLTPDGWQQLVLDDWLGDVDGRWSALTCGLSAPRQNGKNGIIEVRELFGMVGRGEKFLHTAHEVKTARKAFKRLQHFFGRKVGDPTAKFPELNALATEIRNVNGQEAIFLGNGGSVEIAARSQGSTRGWTVDVLVCDEAQDLSDDDLEALMPTTSSAPLGNPQWIFTGTPPSARANGEVFARTRLEALSGVAGRLAWHEWSCEGDVDLDSREAWYRANPALGLLRAGGLHALQLDVVEGERVRLSDDGFARERLGMWAGVGGRTVIDSQTWAECADERSRPVGRFALAVDVSPDRDVASVSFAGQRGDGRWHVELDEERHGVGWLVDYVADQCERNDIRAVVVDGASPAASVVDALGGRGVRVTTTGLRDMAQACGMFYDNVMEGRLRHIDQPQLNAALSVARRRSLQDAWAWHRKNSSSDITPLVACTLALWGAQSSRVSKPRKRRGSGRVVVLS